MNENINLIKILKNCPIGTKFYSSVLNTVVYEGIGERSSYKRRIFVSCDNKVVTNSSIEKTDKDTQSSNNSFISFYEYLDFVVNPKKF